jgi:hypothetical protein
MPQRRGRLIQERYLQALSRQREAQAGRGGCQMDHHTVLVPHRGDTAAPAQRGAGRNGGKDTINVLWGLESLHAPRGGVVGDADARRERTLIYRIDVSIGRWSMIDIFMISILTATARMGDLGSVFPGLGAVAFCAVVVLTIYPNGSASFGNGVEEAQGGIRYIKQRHGTADIAVVHWQQYHWY